MSETACDVFDCFIPTIGSRQNNGIGGALMELSSCLLE